MIYQQSNESTYRPTPIPFVVPYAISQAAACRLLLVCGRYWNIPTLSFFYQAAIVRLCRLRCFVLFLLRLVDGVTFSAIHGVKARLGWAGRIHCEILGVG